MSKFMKIALIWFWICPFLFLTGCWDYQELNEHGFVLAVGIDKSNKKGEFLYTYQLVNPSIISKTTAGNLATPITTYSQSGRTEWEATSRMTQQNSRKLFFSHRQVLVISEEVLKEGGILKILDVLERDPQGRINYPVLIARNTKAAKVLSVLTPIEDISAFELKNKIETSEKNWGENRNTFLEEVLENVTSKGIDVALSGVEIIGSSKQIGQLKSIQQTNVKSQTKLSGIGLFNEGKLVQWTDDETARGIVFGTDKIRRTALNINCSERNNHRLTIIIGQSRTKIKAEIVNNKPVLHMNITAEGRLSEAECPIDLENPKTIETLEKRTADEIKKETKKAVQIAQKQQSDAFGFGVAVHQADPKTWNKWKDNWKQHYKQAQVVIHVKAYIRHTGMRTNPYTKKLN